MTSGINKKNIYLKKKWRWVGFEPPPRSLKLNKKYQEESMHLTTLLVLCSVALCVGLVKRDDTQYYYWAYSLEDAPLQDLKHIVCPLSFPCPALQWHYTPTVFTSHYLSLLHILYASQSVTITTIPAFIQTFIHYCEGTAHLLPPLSSFLSLLTFH